MIDKTMNEEKLETPLSRNYSCILPSSRKYFVKGLNREEVRFGEKREFLQDNKRQRGILVDSTVH